MILMKQIFDVIANENVRYKRIELELSVSLKVTSVKSLKRTPVITTTAPKN